MLSRRFLIHLTSIYISEPFSNIRYAWSFHNTVLMRRSCHLFAKVEVLTYAKCSVLGIGCFAPGRAGHAVGCLVDTLSQSRLYNGLLRWQLAMRMFQPDLTIGKEKEGQIGET